MADITEQAFGSLVEEQKKTTNALSNVRSMLKQQTDLQYAVTDSQKEGLKIERAMQQAAQDNYRKNAKDKAKDDSQASKKAEDEDKKGIQNKKMLSFLNKMSVGLTDMGKSLADKAKSVGGDIWSVLKKMALGVALLGLIAFLQSPYWEDFRKWVVETLPKLLMILWDYVLAPIARGLGKITDVLTGKKEWTDLFDWDVIGTITAIAALLFPFKTIKLLGGAAKLFKNALFRSSKKLDTISQEMDPSKDKGKDKTKKPRGRGKFGRVLDLGKRAGPKIASTAKTVGSAIAGAPSKIMGGMRTAGSAIANIGPKILSVGSKLLGPISLALMAVKGTYDGVAAGMKEAEKETSDKVDVAREGFSGMLAGMSMGFGKQETYSKLMTATGNLVSAVGGKLGDLVSPIGDKFGEMSSIVGDKISGMSSIVGDKISGVWNGITNWVGCLFEPFTNLFNKDFGIMEKINNLWTDVTSWLGDFFGDFVKLFDLDFKAIIKSIIPGGEVGEKVMGWLGLGGSTDEGVTGEATATHGPSGRTKEHLERMTTDMARSEDDRDEAKTELAMIENIRQQKRQKQQAIVKGLLEKVKSDKADVAEVSEGFGIGWAKFGAEDKKEQEEDRKRLEQSQRQLAEARAKLQSMGGSLQDNSTRVDASKTSTTHVNGSIPMTNQNDAVRMAAAGAS